MTRHRFERRMWYQHGRYRREQREWCIAESDLPRSGLDGVDHDSSNRVICRAQKHRTVIEISSDDDDVGEATPAAKPKGR